MHAALLLAGALGALGVTLLLVTLWSRRNRGFERGETVALDDVTLYSSRHKIVGRPDRIVKRGRIYIPEEWKSSQRVSHGHRLQLGAYFILIEEHYGVRPPHGVVVLGDGSREQVENTDALRAEVLSIAGHIRERRRTLTDPVPVNQPTNKCRACGQRSNCGQASG